MILVNGAPGSGKSTIAALMAAADPATTAIDLDTIKHGLPGWPADPVAAGLEARRHALVLAATELRAGHDVVIGQYVARTAFVERLGALAQDQGARFIEVVLEVDPATLVRRLGERAQHPVRPEHVVINRLVGPADAPSLFSLADVMQRRPWTHLVDANGWVQRTLVALRHLLRELEAPAGAAPTD